MPNPALISKYFDAITKEGKWLKAAVWLSEPCGEYLALQKK